MNARCLQWLFVLGLSGAGVTPVQADSPPPVTVHPQWMTTFWRDVLADDRIAAPAGGPTWARLPDGHTVLVSVRGNALLLRRFTADGAVRDARWESLAEAGISDDASDVVVGFDAPGHGLYVLAGTAGGACQVLRLQVDLRRAWSVPTPGGTPYGNRCLGLYVLPDGSAVVARQTSLSRIDANGRLRWTVNDGDGGRSLKVNDVALDANGTIWVAADHDNKAAVLRFSAEGGAFLSADEFRCARCVASQAISIAVAPDGSVAVGGGSGSFQPGFLARYAADGARRLLVETADDVAYARVTHDASGAIYVLATMPTTPPEVRRVDATSGAVLWAAAGDDFAITDDGVVSTLRSSAGIVAVALDDAGNTLWTRQLSTSPAASVSRGFARDGTTELLLRDPSQASSDCGSAPQLLALDGSGAIATALRACAMPAAARPQEVDALAGVGALANLGYRLISYTPEGIERWRATRCELCGGSRPGDRRWVAAALTADGGAWAVAAEPPSSALPGGATTVQRIEADGHSSLSVPAAAGATANSEIRLLGTTQEIVMLHAAPASGVTWQRVRRDGSAPLVRNYPVPDHFFQIDAARRLDDGGLTLVVKGEVICSTGCEPRYVTLLSLAADGGLRWRYQFPEFEAMIALGADGGAMAVLPWADAGGLLRLRAIGADGHVGASLMLADLPPFIEPAQLSGPVDGRWLLRTEGGLPWENALWLIDAAGHVAAAQRDGPGAWTHSANAFGYLLSERREDGASVALRDPTSLAVQAQFLFGGSGSPYFDFGPWPWRLLDDGSVYGTVLTSRAGLMQWGLARYPAPGSPPSNLLFRDGFD